ncbi:MAG: hypothetical protein Q8N27_03465 [Candidatus Hydromicrobium sp.]|nr:hypothetical protein [Candidatus Hydromicrobium sp.]
MEEWKWNEKFNTLEIQVKRAVDTLDKLVTNLGVLNEHLDDLKNIVAPILGFKIKRG